MFLIDAGAEVESGYAGDMSSTIPADKKFTTRQREVYEIQNAMHLESVKALRPGIPYMDVYELSARIMVDGMKTLGLMKGNTEDAVREGAHALFYPHGLGHMMGLDVHDMENLGEIWVGYNGQPKSTQFGRKSQRLAIPLEPGFVHTVEPGIYFIPELIDMWKAEKKFTDFINYEIVETYKDFGGIRNEEDYLITETGARRLGKKIPLTPEEVESFKIKSLIKIKRRTFLLFKINEVVSKRWHNLFYILQFCYIFFWLCCFFLMHLATSCYIPIISGYK